MCVGVFMRDLTFFNDGNEKFLKNGLINFSKLRMMVLKVSVTVSPSLLSLSLSGSGIELVRGSIAWYSRIQQHWYSRIHELCVLVASEPPSLSQLHSALSTSDPPSLMT